jgi:hypothetical protein
MALQLANRELARQVGRRTGLMIADLVRCEPLPASRFLALQVKDRQSGYPAETLVRASDAATNGAHLDAISAFCVFGLGWAAVCKRHWLAGFFLGLAGHQAGAAAARSSLPAAKPLAYHIDRGRPGDGVLLAASGGPQRWKLHSSWNCSAQFRRRSRAAGSAGVTFPANSPGTALASRHAVGLA